MYSNVIKNANNLFFKRHVDDMNKIDAVFLEKVYR